MGKTLFILLSCIMDEKVLTLKTHRPTAVKKSSNRTKRNRERATQTEIAGGDHDRRRTLWSRSFDNTILGGSVGTRYSAGIMRGHGAFSTAEENNGVFGGGVGAYANLGGTAGCEKTIRPKAGLL